MTMKSKTKSTTAHDVEVGQRIRARRMAKGMSQTELGNLLGVTFQQVQKYEKGSNRIGASRLQHIAEILQVPISFFFDGAGEPGEFKPMEPKTLFISDFLATSEGVALVKAYMKIKNARLRRCIVQLVEQIVPRAH